MDLGIAGKWALVCGASKGLGLGCAQALVREGVNVVIAARGAEGLQVATAGLLGDPLRPAATQVLSVASDVTTPEGRAALFAVPLFGAGAVPAQVRVIVTGALAVFVCCWTQVAAPPAMMTRMPESASSTAWT